MRVGAYLPNSRAVGDVIWLAFVTVQILDGVMSYIGVSTYGLGIEANPIVGWYADALGPALGLLAAKVFAVCCGTVLYAMARHRALAMLTVLYVLLAVGPWLHVLAS